MIKWNKKHPKGGRPQYLGMSTGSGFWPSGSWLKGVYWPYLDKCKIEGINPVSAEKLYKGIAQH